MALWWWWHDVRGRGLEAQRVRGDHAPVLHHGGGDGTQVLEELLGLAGASRSRRAVYCFGFVLFCFFLLRLLLYLSG